MKLAALALYGTAFLLQVAGDKGLVRAVRTGIRNMRQFEVALSTADEKAVEHCQVMDNTYNEYVQASSANQREAWNWQTGPAGKLQRDAVVKYVTAQNDISDRRRWTAVGLLLSGLVLGFVGNVLSLYAQ